jgi:hypothetical protein
MSRCENDEQSTSAREHEAVIKAAWLEWLVTKQWQGGDHRLVEMYPEVESWFRDVELGLGINQGPSIFWTLQNLEKINRRNQRKLACRRQSESDVF